MRSVFEAIKTPSTVALVGSAFRVLSYHERATFEDARLVHNALTSDPERKAEDFFKINSGEPEVALQIVQKDVVYWVRARPKKAESA